MLNAGPFIIIQAMDTMLHLSKPLSQRPFSFIRFPQLGEVRFQDPGNLQAALSGGSEKSMLEYTIEQVRTIVGHSTRWFLSIFVGSGFWAAIHSHFEGFLITDAVFLLPTLWTISWVCGVLWAVKEGRFSRSKAQHSIWKLAGYCGILIVAHLFRGYSPVLGYPAAVLELACIFTEGYNALENAAGLTDNAFLKKMIGFSKVRVQDQVSRLVGAVSEIKEQHAELQAKVVEAKTEVEAVKTEVQNVQSVIANVIPVSELQLDLDNQESIKEEPDSTGSGENYTDTAESPKTEPNPGN